MSKRPRDDSGGRSGPKAHRKQAAVQGPHAAAFQTYADILDARAQRRDDVIGVNRQVTADSKKLIFLLHRVTSGEAAAGLEQKTAILDEAATLISGLKGTLTTLKAHLDGEGEGAAFWRLHPSWTGGVQELIEGLSFYHYLRNTPPCSGGANALITLEEARELVDFPITYDDYLLGVADLTGELMRFATNSLNAGNLEAPFSVLEAISELARAFTSITNVPFGSKLGKELRKKQELVDTSLVKVEKLCYSLRVKRNIDPKRLTQSIQDAPKEFGGGGGGGDEN